MELERTDFCCEEMYENIIGPDKDGGELYFEYDPQTRRYSIGCKPWFGCDSQRINNCPWCGIKLPTPLVEEYATALSTAMGIPVDKLLFASDNEIVLEAKKIPLEFQGDLWWKKRKL